ncbi:MAG: discoidin domain-containing protein [Candidatus Marinimicrobia bacterium]|nr:discoidin domain-containing protein [Candidatus Brocadiales bacterium]MBL7047683.1 discoidin domain-containing protein [Candidatus Neomarinimicrobiota bacterium]
MRNILPFFFSLILIISCTNTADILNTWLGLSKHDLIVGWGPPLRTEPDGKGGEIAVYAKQLYEDGTTGYSWTDKKGTTYTTAPEAGYHYWRWYYFYINAQDKIYHWRYEDNQAAPKQVDVYHHDEKPIVNTQRKSLKNVASSRGGGRATARDYGTHMGNARYPSYINDENFETKWAGMRMPAWCQIEFDREYVITSIRCTADYHTQSYRLELSRNGTNWNTVANHTTPNNQPSGQSEGRDPYEIKINNTHARFARVVITSTDAPRSHLFQAIISELEVFGY